MTLIENTLNKRLMTLRYLRDELIHLKYLSPKGEKRLYQLQYEIKNLEGQLAVPEYREMA
jgi:hypothetical protein